MSNDRQQVSYGHSHKGVGVSGYAIPNEAYEPKKHNHTAPIRAGSMDAYNCPSLDHTGERKPYWGIKERLMKTRIAGIPCTVDYTIRGKYVPAKINADPDSCYEAEHPEVEFTVCDSNGRLAPWLVAKMTEKDYQRIEAEILKYAETI